MCLSLSHSVGIVPVWMGSQSICAMVSAPFGIPAPVSRCHTFAERVGV